MTAHFAFSEFTNSDTATRLGVENTPSAAVSQRIFKLMDSMEIVRNVLDAPVFISSGFRCEELEKVICAKDYRAWCKRHGYKVDDDSWALYFVTKSHPAGYSADFTSPAAGTPTQIVTLLQRERVRFDQLICEGTWVHISFDPRMRGQVLNATFIDGTPTYAARML